jgi:mono/diheme cytochrome c family protein
MQSDAPPIHPNLNMDFQEKFEAQEANPFFEDDAAMRPIVPGTVKRTGLRTTENAPFFLGRSADGAYVPEIPMAVTPAVLERGQERYNIFCTPCHGYSGDGLGIIMTGNGGQGYGYTPAPSYHTDGLRARADGYIYDVIANGVRSMPSYAHQISVPDRWAIVAYIRALQRSQNAGADDVPAPIRDQLESYNPNVTVQ